MAEDTAGEAAAGPFYDAAEATYTTLVDPRHELSSLYGMVNVPTAVLIDEQGTIVRWDEGTYTKKYGSGDMTFGTDEYVPMVRDWVARGADSEYVLDAKTLAEQLPERTDAAARGDANFRLGAHFELLGDHELAARYWQEAQRLNPDSWNYHRQEWSYEPSEAGRKWFAKYQTLEGRPYYRPMAGVSDAPEDEP